MKKICIQCKIEFEGNLERKFCSKSCSNLFKKVETKKRIELGIEKDYRWVKAYLIEKLGNICSSCGLSEWLNNPIPLVLDHIDGNSDNNKLENCRLLCNNCDSFTETYKGRNKGNGRYIRRLRYKQNKSY